MLSTSSLPTTVGGTLKGYSNDLASTEDEANMTITCLCILSAATPAWTWAEDYSTATAVVSTDDDGTTVTYSVSGTVAIDRR